MDFKSIPNPTLGDVPDDVFRYVMFPYMDYDSRINFNQVMPPDWRVSRKFKEYTTLSHDVYTLTTTIGDAMDKVLENGDVNGRALAMTNMFNLCARPRMLAFISKCKCANRFKQATERNCGNRQQVSTEAGQHRKGDDRHQQARD